MSTFQTQGAMQTTKKEYFYLHIQYIFIRIRIWNSNTICRMHVNKQKTADAPILSSIFVLCNDIFYFVSCTCKFLYFIFQAVHITGLQLFCTMQCDILFCILYMQVFIFYFLGSAYHWPLVILNHAIFILLLYFVHQYFFKSLSVGIKLEFIGITARSLFIIKMYNCDFYLNKSSPKAQNYISCFKYICLIGTFLRAPLLRSDYS